MKLPTIEEWACALESGEFEQCREALRVDDKYCCLGVHAELSGVEYDENSMYLFPGGPSSWANPLVEAYGMDCTGEPAATWRGLAAENDSGTSFDEIATILRGWLADGLIHEAVQ